MEARTPFTAAFLDYEHKNEPFSLWYLCLLILLHTNQVQLAPETILINTLPKNPTFKGQEYRVKGMIHLEKLWIKDRIAAL